MPMPGIDCLWDRGKADRRQTSSKGQPRKDRSRRISRQMSGAPPEGGSGRTCRDPEPPPTRPAFQRSRRGQRIAALSTVLDREWTPCKVLRSPAYSCPVRRVGCGSSKFMDHANHILIGSAAAAAFCSAEVLASARLATPRIRPQLHCACAVQPGTPPYPAVRRRRPLDGHAG